MYLGGAQCHVTGQDKQHQQDKDKALRGANGDKEPLSSLSGLGKEYHGASVLGEMSAVSVVQRLHTNTQAVLDVYIYHSLAHGLYTHPVRYDVLVSDIVMSSNLLHSLQETHTHTHKVTILETYIYV